MIGRAKTDRMRRVALDFGGPAQVAFRENADSTARERHGRRIEQRLPWNQVFGLPDVGHDGFGGLLRTRGRSGQRQRGSHQLEERAPAVGIVPIRVAVGELVLNKPLELFGVGEFFQAAPVLRAFGGLQFSADRIQVERAAFAAGSGSPEGRIWTRLPSTGPEARPGSEWLSIIDGTSNSQ